MSDELITEHRVSGEQVWRGAFLDVRRDLIRQAGVAQGRPEARI